MTVFPSLHHAYLDYTGKARREGGRDSKETAIAVAAALVATVALVGALLSVPVNVGWPIGKHIWLKVYDPKALELTEEQKKWNLEHGRGVGPRTLESAAFEGLLDGALNVGGFFLAAIPFAPLFILHNYLHSVPSQSEQGQNQLASRIALLEEDRANIARNLINVNLRGFHPPVSRDEGIGSEI